MTKMVLVVFSLHVPIAVEGELSPSPISILAQEKKKEEKKTRSCGEAQPSGIL